LAGYTHFIDLVISIIFFVLESSHFFYVDVFVSPIFHQNSHIIQTNSHTSLTPIH